MSQLKHCIRVGPNLQLSRWEPRHWMKFRLDFAVLDSNTAAELEAALKKGMAASRDGKSFLVDASTSCWGGGAESTWYERYNFFESTKRKA